MQLTGMVMLATTALVELARKEPIWLIHIPKAGGTSFFQTMRTNFKYKFLRHSPGSDERCFGESVGHQRTVAFFRDPESHVYSQYLECKYDKWGISVTRNTKFPRESSEDPSTGHMPNFRKWLLHFAKSNDHFNCYHPLNMQTRYMTCGKMEDGHSLLRNRNSVHDAINNMRSLWSIGITSHMAASVCLARAQSGELQRGAVCGNKGEFKIFHTRHFVPKDHSLTKLPEDIRKMILSYIDQDLMLYEAAKEEFFFRIQQFKEIYNITIVI